MLTILAKPAMIQREPDKIIIVMVRPVFQETIVPQVLAIIMYVLLVGTLELAFAQVILAVLILIVSQVHV